MKPEGPDKLLEKYYEGNTSEAEELLLRQYFCKEDSPAGYETEKEIFGFYSDLEKIPEPSADFEKRILAGIDRNIFRSDLQKKRRLFLSLMGAAAGVLILTGSYFFFIHRAEPRDTFSDPELAYAETLKILYNVSSGLNHGTQSLKPLSKMQVIPRKSFKAIDKSAKIFEEKMKSLNYISEAFNIVSLPSGERNTKIKK